MAGAGRGSILGRLGGIFSGFGGGGSAVGLSIGTSAIKLVELKKSGKNLKLLHFGMIQLPEDAIINREIVNNIAVTESIKTLVSQVRLKNKNVCTSISGTSLIVKRMSVEVAKSADIQDQVFWEAEQYLPFDISEVVMDYQLLSRTKEGKADVILVAAKKTFVDSYIDCTEDAGLKTKILDLDFFALQNLFEANYPQNPNEAVCIADIGASAIKVVVVHNQIPVFTKDSGIGGKNLTSEIQKHLNLSYMDAETLKTGGSGGTLPQEVMDLMSIMAENFATEIKRALDFYEASSSGAPVAYLLITGGSAKIPNLTQVIEDTVGLPTQILNPFNAITYDPSVFTQDYIDAVAPIAAVPLGLAMRMAGK